MNARIEGYEEYRKFIAKQMKEMQEQYHITWDFCRKSMIPIRKKYGLDSIFALTKAEDIWHGVEKCLYGNGTHIHFSKYGEFPSIRAKERIRGLILQVKDGKLIIKYRKGILSLIEKDRFHHDEIQAILEYMSHPEDRAIPGILMETER